jgi:hypothetical protein
VTQIVDRPKTIRALTMARNEVAFTVASAEFHENPMLLLSEGKAQIQAAIPKFGTGFEFLLCVPMKSWRRRHSTKKCVDHHGRCSFMIEKSGLPIKVPTIKSKFSRMRKTGVKNP